MRTNHDVAIKAEHIFSKFDQFFLRGDLENY